MPKRWFSRVFNYLFLLGYVCRICTRNRDILTLIHKKTQIPFWQWGILQYDMNIQYKRILLQGIVALVIVNMPIQSALQLSDHRASNMMHCKLQIMFDQALFSNTNALFLDCRWIEPYDRTNVSYGTCNSNEQTAQFWFEWLKIDQVSPVSILDAIDVPIFNFGRCTIRVKIIVNKANTST